MKLLFFELRAERSAPMTPCLSFPRWIPRFIVKFVVPGLVIALVASLAACGGATSSPSSTSSGPVTLRSEEHTSELQSHLNLVCRLLLEKKKTQSRNQHRIYERQHA